MDFTGAFEAAGFQAAKPSKEKVRRRHFSHLGCEIPAEVEAFYEHCDGGTVDALSCRAYPLSQAVGLVGTYDFHAELRFLPFFVADENASDPAMVGLEPPLSGYVFQICHDDRSRMLAPSILSFLESLPSQPDGEFFCLEEATLVYPKALSESEQATVDALIARSMTELEDEYEAELLVELALSMLTDEACIELLAELRHPDHNARFVIKDRLEEIGTPAAQELLAKADDELKAFVSQAIEVLADEGITAVTQRGTDLRVSGETDTPLNVAAFFDDRADDGFWEHFVERVRRILERQRTQEADPAPPQTAGESAGSDLPRSAQEVAEVLGLDEDTAGLLWDRWFAAEGQARMAEEELGVAEYWDTLQGIPPEAVRDLIAMEMDVAAPRAGDSGDLPKDAQEVADVLGLDEDNAGWLWNRWFTAEAQVGMAAEGVDVAEHWDSLQGIPPEGIRGLVAMEMEEAALRAKADAARAKRNQDVGE